MDVLEEQNVNKTRAGKRNLVEIFKFALAAQLNGPNIDLGSLACSVFQGCKKCGRPRPALIMC